MHDRRVFERMEKLDKPSIAIIEHLVQGVVGDSGRNNLPLLQSHQLYFIAAVAGEKCDGDSNAHSDGADKDDL